MDFSMREHCKVVGVDDHNAYLQVTIPLWLLDSLPAFLDSLAYVCRWTKTQSRWKSAARFNEVFKSIACESCRRKIYNIF